MPDLTTIDKIDKFKNQLNKKHRKSLKMLGKTVFILNS